MFNYNEKRVVDLEETKAKDYIQRGPVEAMARQARLAEARQANGPTRARNVWTRFIAVILILVVVAAVLVQIFIVH
jgi:cell division protein FtsL